MKSFNTRDGHQLINTFNYWRYKFFKSSRTFTFQKDTYAGRGVTIFGLPLRDGREA
jgi:hypothetical protein